jgi:hypothetical protein
MESCGQPESVTNREIIRVSVVFNRLQKSALPYLKNTRAGIKNTNSGLEMIFILSEVFF